MVPMHEVRALAAVSLLLACVGAHRSARAEIELSENDKLSLHAMGYCQNATTADPCPEHRVEREFDGELIKGGAVGFAASYGVAAAVGVLNMVACTYAASDQATC